MKSKIGLLLCLSLLASRASAAFAGDNGIDALLKFTEESSIAEQKAIAEADKIRRQEAAAAAEAEKSPAGIEEIRLEMGKYIEVLKSFLRDPKSKELAKNRVLPGAMIDAWGLTLSDDPAQWSKAALKFKEVIDLLGWHLCTQADKDTVREANAQLDELRMKALPIYAKLENFLHRRNAAAPVAPADSSAEAVKAVIAARKAFGSGPGTSESSAKERKAKFYEAIMRAVRLPLTAEQNGELKTQAKLASEACLYELGEGCRLHWEIYALTKEEYENFLGLLNKSGRF